MTTYGLQLEVEAKEAQLILERDTALEAAKVLTPATAEFDEAYGRYLDANKALARIPEELAKAKLVENAEAIKTASVAVAEAITQLISGLNVAALLGVPVTSLRYAVDAEGVAKVSFNPVTHIKSAGAKKSKGAGRTAIIAPDGTKLTLTRFVLAHATEAEKETPEFKWPHTRVDTKPKFEKFCEEHSLTGFTYEVPDKAEAS